jgi:hypothetical protein
VNGQIDMEDIEEEAVYAALFEGNDHPIVLGREVYNDPSYSKSFDQDIPRETIDNYLSRNKRPKPFSGTMNIGIRYVFADDRKGLHRIYPDAQGFHRLSRVGFNLTFTEALVCLEWKRGPRNGEGGYHILKKVDGVWKKDRYVRIWIF